MRYLPLFFISAAVLGLEIALMRLWMIVEYHHLSYFVISTALLGFGASGTVISLLRAWVFPRAETLTRNCAWGMALATPASALLCQALPLRSLELLWNPVQWVWIVATQIVLFVPFFFGALAIGLALIAHAKEAGRWYGVNLFGSGVGVCTFVLLQYFLPVQVLVAAASGLAALSALLSPSKKTPSSWSVSIAGVMAVLALGAAVSLNEPRVNEFKKLPGLLRLSQAKQLARKQSPLGRLDVVASPAIHEVVDLSPLFAGTLPEQTVLTIDAGHGTVLSRIESASDCEYLDWSISAVPYHVRSPNCVLVVGSGGGTDLHLARYHGAREITALELNGQIVDLVSGPLSEAAGGINQASEVSVVVAEARSWMERIEQEFDLISIPLLDAFSTASAGVYALNESYLYTKEALHRMLDRLSSDGCLSIIRWIQYPPRDTIKLLATAIEVLREKGVATPENHLLMVRFQFAANLMVFPAPLDDETIESFKDFCRSRNFQAVWYPGMPESEAGASHGIGKLTAAGRFEGRAAIHEAARALLFGDAESYYRDSLFDVRPATDDRPYFFSFFRWRLLPLLERLGPGAVAQVEFGSVFLLLNFIQALILAAVLILLPLGWLGKKRNLGLSRFQTGSFFFLVGIAYLFLEMAFIQKITLFLGDPVLSAAVVLCGFLFFSGLGSLFGNRFGRTPSVRIVRSVLAVVVVGCAYTWFLGWALSPLGSLPILGRALLSLAITAPLAFAMGIPFSQGLVRCERRNPEFLPWAWGGKRICVGPFFLARRPVFDVLRFQPACLDRLGFLYARRLACASPRARRANLRFATALSFSNNVPPKG